MSTAKNMEAKVTRAGANIFSDLGFGNEQAEHLRMRSTLMIALRHVIDDRGLTQADAARLFAVTQPRVSDLVRGRIELFSIDMLIRMLARAGVGVSVSLAPLARVAEPARGASRKSRAARTAKPA